MKKKESKTQINDRERGHRASMAKLVELLLSNSKILFKSLQGKKDYLSQLLRDLEL
jgi:hypothetical protein